MWRSLSRINKQNDKVYMLTGRVELIFVTLHHNRNKLSRKEIQICVSFLIYMQLVFFSCLTQKNYI
jgi:hypothetical protein